MRLTKPERVWARDILDTVYPRGADPHLPTGIADLDVDDYLDDLGRTWPAVSFLGFRAAIVLIALSPLLVLGVPRTFHGLSRERRVRVLEKLYASSIYVVRQLVVFVKATGGLLYGAASPVREALTPSSVPAPNDTVLQLRRKEVHA